MTLNIPGSLFKQPPEFLTNFDFNDVASATGVVEFYGTKIALSGAAVEWVLLDNQLSQLQSSTGDQTDVKFLTSEFLRPRVIRGTPYASIPQAAYNPNGIGGTENVHCSGARLVKVNLDGTETVLTNFVDTTLTQEDTEGDTTNYDIAIKWNDIDNVLVRKGEKLGLYLDVIATSRGTIFHDPANGTVENDILGTEAGEVFDHTRLVVQIPFRLDV